MLENIVQGSNFDRDEVERIRKRFMKLDKDNSGTIERDEFLSLPQISSNPLATRSATYTLAKVLALAESA